MFVGSVWIRLFGLLGAPYVPPMEVFDHLAYIKPDLKWMFWNGPKLNTCTVVKGMDVFGVLLPM